MAYDPEAPERSIHALASVEARLVKWLTEGEERQLERLLGRIWCEPITDDDVDCWVWSAVHYGGHWYGSRFMAFTLRSAATADRS